MPKKPVDPVYQKLVEDIKVEGEAFADDAMKAVYLEQKAAMDELHDLISKSYLNYSKEGVIVLTSAQQKQMAAAMKIRLKKIGQSLGGSEVEKVTSMLAEIFSATYYKNAFALESGLKTNMKFDMLKKEYIQAAVKAKYKGEMFSDRIWQHKALLIDSLQDGLINAHSGKLTIDKIGKLIKERFAVTAFESQRLVRTENARVQSSAIDEIGQSAGVNQQMFTATLDGKTNPEDASFDGKVYGIDDSDKPIPPLHPNCRCILINIPFEGWSPTARKDNETKEVVAYKDYEDWAKDKGVSNG